MNASDSPLRLSWRIGYPSYMHDPHFDNLLAFLREHKSVVDEVCLFETLTHHLYLPMEQMIRTAGVMTRRFEQLRAMGVRSVGVNVLTTVGHVNEAWDSLPELPFQPMVGHDGSISHSCACPNTKALRRYIRQKYELFAGTKPDFIWIDDDIRLHHHGVAYACFCRTCLNLFAKRVGRRYSRKALVKAFNDPAHGDLRAAWLEHNIATIESLLSHVRESIHCVDDTIATGLMTAGSAWTTYSGQHFERWFNALHATKARPGGGFYDDERPIAQFNKAMEIDRQVDLLPTSARQDCQYELENFPYSSLNKAKTTVVNECTLALAAGCTGIAFNALGAISTHSLDDKHALVRRIEQARPFWEQLHAHIHDLPACGLWIACHPQLMAHRKVNQGEDWFDGTWYDITRPNALARLGLPVSGQRSDLGSIWVGRVIETFSDDEIKCMLKGSVLMDAFALQSLHERGLGDLAGVRVERWIDNGVAEMFTDDPMNQSFAGSMRDIRNEFWGDCYLNSALLTPTHESVKVLTRLCTFHGEDIGPAMTCHENALGGRAIVMGYAPWRYLGSDAKRQQLIRAIDWSTRQTLPVIVNEVVPLVPMVRMSPDRQRGAVVLLNAGIDRIEQATIELRATPAQIQQLVPGVDASVVETRRVPHGVQLTLRGLEPWNCSAIGWL